MLHNSKLIESKSKFYVTRSEQLVAENGNASIVLGGGDRPGHPQGPGHGAKGHGRSNKIDIVVGRHSSSKNADDPDVLIHPKSKY